MAHLVGKGAAHIVVIQSIVTGSGIVAPYAGIMDDDTVHALGGC